MVPADLNDWLSLDRYCFPRSPQMEGLRLLNWLTLLGQGTLTHLLWWKPKMGRLQGSQEEHWRWADIFSLLLSLSDLNADYTLIIVRSMSVVAWKHFSENYFSYFTWWRYIIPAKYLLHGLVIPDFKLFFVWSSSYRQSGTIHLVNIISE